MGTLFFHRGPSQLFQNHHPELVMCNFSESAAPLRSCGAEGRGAGVFSWYSHVRGSLEIHGDMGTFLFCWGPSQSKVIRK
jgi:hypothetical protein